MKTWDINTVRVPLNEDCWLGINGVNAAYSGANYQSAVANYVATLQAAGIVPILDLHWNAAGTTLAASQQLMADEDHSPAFWTSVATYFKSNPGVIFDLYNEPHDISWSCWLNGCTTSGGWVAAGMQQLVTAVRATGATQPIMVGGLNWGGDLSQWLAYEPSDPLHQLIASVHIYNFSQDNTVASWNQTIAPVAAQVPVVTGELGENDCAHGFIDQYMAWADSQGVSYLGWTWDSTASGWSCSSGPALIADYTGTPTGFGIGLEQHLLALGGGGNAGTGGTPAPAPNVSLSTTSLALPTTQVGKSSAPSTITVTNTGTAPLSVQAAAIGGANASDFVLGTNTCTSVAPNATCTLQVTFVPTVAGARSGTLTLSDGAVSSPQVIALSGTATAPATTPGSVTVKYQVVNSWPQGLQANLIITNTGTTTIGSASSPWVVKFTLPSSETVTSLWNATGTYSTNGSLLNVTATAPSWQQTLAPGQSWSVGYVTNNGTTGPANCSFNGAACTILPG
jgi:Cellulase (glycosyl hydrolase family 5)/Cellulose binding domain/Abnormal spindle-like microcephaly-assoc'd, ASPM-SPD-2-Hydin